MNWHVIISVVFIVVLKIVGMTLFLLYFPQIFDGSQVNFIPTESYGTVPQTTKNSNINLVTTESPETDCPKGWYFHRRRCFWLSPFEGSWNKSRDFCKTEGSTLAVVNTSEKLKFLQDKAGAEKYFIGLHQQAKNRWQWIDNSIFNGNITNQHQNFNCVTIGLTRTYDAAPCDVNFRWICEKAAKWLQFSVASDKNDKYTSGKSKNNIIGTSSGNIEYQISVSVFHRSLTEVSNKSSGLGLHSPSTNILAKVQQRQTPHSGPATSPRLHFLWV